MLKDSDVDLVKSSVNMVQLARAYGFKVNRNGFMLCPFHQDKHPSMQAFGGYTTNDGFFCHVCLKGGDIIKFVQEYEGLEFKAAVRRIAAMFSIPLVEGEGLSAEDKRRIAERKAVRQQERQQEEADRQAMIALADKIHLYERLIGEVTPFGELFCYLANRLPVLVGEWEERFERAK